MTDLYVSFCVRVDCSCLSLIGVQVFAYSTTEKYEALTSSTPTVRNSTRSTTRMNPTMRVFEQVWRPFIKHP